jgi:hypothetical protein
MAEPVLGDQGEDQSKDAVIQKLLDRVAALEREVAALQQAQAPRPATESTPNSTTATNVDAAAPVDNSSRFNFHGYAVERLVLQYRGSDFFNADIGSYRTAIGYYSTAYLRGSWLQTAISRPKMFTFEDQGGFLPLHAVGVSVNGRIPSGDLSLFMVHFMYVRGRVELLNEGLLIGLRDQSLGSATNLGFYSQIADRVAPSWKPYTRVEYLNVYGARALSTATARQYAPWKTVYTGAVRDDLMDSVALKFELGRETDYLRADYITAAVQLAFAF